MTTVTGPAARADGDLPLLPLLAAQVEAVAERQVSPSSSSHLSETVGWRLRDGSSLLAHVKRSGSRSPSFGHRGGVEREIQVYRTVLDPSRDGTPRLLGWDLSEAGAVLVVEHLPGMLTLSKADPPALEPAARWLARFHARGDAADLPRVDADYLAGWLHRAAEQQRREGCERRTLTLLDRLCADPEPFVRPLLARSRSVVHGEFFPDNVLWDGEHVHPVDWESAAVGDGAIDLASLVDGWPDALVDGAVDAYLDASPGASRSDLLTRLAAARLYWSLRWLGDGRPWTPDTRREAVRELGARLRLVLG